MYTEWLVQDGYELYIPGGLPEVGICNVLLFYEKKDADKYLSLSETVRFYNGALVAIGHRPTPLTLFKLKSVFVNARFLACFGADLPATVLTCRLSLWLKQLDASFLILDGRLHFIFKSRSFCCPVHSFSLHRFCMITGFRTNIRVLKDNF